MADPGPAVEMPFLLTAFISKRCMCFIKTGESVEMKGRKGGCERAFFLQQKSELGQEE